MAERTVLLCWDVMVEAAAGEAYAFHDVSIVTASKPWRLKRTVHCRRSAHGFVFVSGAYGMCALLLWSIICS